MAKNSMMRPVISNVASRSLKSPSRASKGAGKPPKLTSRQDDDGELEHILADIGGDSDSEQHDEVIKMRTCGVVVHFVKPRLCRNLC